MLCMELGIQKWYYRSVGKDCPIKDVGATDYLKHE